MDQELPKATEGHMLCFLVTPIANVGREDRAHQALQPPAHPTVSASGFPPTLNFDILASLVPNELLGPVFDDLGLQEGSEGSRDAK